ncbi:MAG TPA: acyltransferase [Bacteroidia bacterium]|nr:acyltransferase [Bacteroidia bacterium]HNP97673.1 acyltransferase [Bacteroidia bacterium]
MTEKNFRVNNFDLLRILAAVQVVVSHGFHHLHLDKSNTLFRFIEKFPGVPVFFTISGFLIAASFEKNSNLKIYFSNRVLRIFPGLWVCIFFSILTAAIVGNINFMNPVSFPWLLGQLSFMQFFNPDFLRGYGTGVLNGSLWTITVELQFYLLLPLLYFFFKKSKSVNLLLLLLFIAFFLSAILLHAFRLTETQNKFLAVTFLPHYYLFLAGMMMWKIKAYNSALINGKGLVWLAIFLLFVYAVPDSSITSFIGKILLSVFTISAAYTFPKLSRKLLKGNDLSYGIYIYHMPVINMLVEKNQISSANYFFLALFATLVLAFLSWKFVEEKFIRMKKSSLLRQ